MLGIPRNTSEGNRDTAIGVFDSGVGGLSVLREIRNLLPREDLLYVADSGAAPYGEKSMQFVNARTEAIARFFVRENVKAIVVACNTATAVAVHALRANLKIPIVAIEPAVKPAAQVTQSGVIGILATHRTLASESFSRLKEQHSETVQVLLQPCPGLVAQVENGELDGTKTQDLIARYVCPLVEKGADTIVLGCTHYPFLLSTINAVAGPTVKVIDPATAVARQLQRRLESNELLTYRATLGVERFWTSGTSVARAEAVITQLWGKSVKVRFLPSHFCVP